MPSDGYLLKNKNNPIKSSHFVFVNWDYQEHFSGCDRNIKQ